MDALLISVLLTFDISNTLSIFLVDFEHVFVFCVIRFILRF